MHYAVRLAAAVLATVLILGASSGPRARHVRAGSYDFAAADAIAASTVTTNGLAGGSLILADEDEILFEKGYGSYTSTTIVPIASGSKWLSGAAIMTLVDDGLIDLDAPISTYLPTWIGTKGTITTRQLFSHTSGLVDEHPCEDDHTTITLAQCVDQIYAAPLAHIPSAVLNYGGVSMKVGGRIAEVVTGQTWTELFAERITGPVGMPSTFFFQQQNPAVAGGALSTSADYTRFLRMLLRGGELDGVTVLSPAAVAAMTVDSAGGAPNVSGGNNKYGIGNWVDTAGPLGTTIQSASYGALGTTPWINWQRGYTGVFLVWTEVNGMQQAGNAIQAAANAATVDDDLDEIGDTIDNCLGLANPSQSNADRNYVDHSPPYAANVDDRTVPNSDSTGNDCDDDDDNDGRTDANELSGGVCGTITDPLLADSDGDRALDGAECVLGTDPNNAAAAPLLANCGPAGDTDGDKLADRVENCYYNTLTNNTDSDGDKAIDGATDGCEVASINADRVVNSGDQGMLGGSISGLFAYHPSTDLNKDGVSNSGDQGLMASFISPAGQCPG